MPAAPPFADEASVHDRFSLAWLWLCGAVLIACSLVFVAMTRHWPMVGDAALMSYAVFLIRHGWTPYRDFLDINMPGAYWATAVGMHLAASADTSWRIFDLGLIGLTGVGYFVIARPYSRFAALFATALLLLVHGQDGVQQAGQRDLVMAALLVLAVAFLLEAVRRDSWLYLAPFGLAVGVSATIKPTAAPLGVVLLVMAATYRASLWRAGLPEKTREPYRAADQRGWVSWTLIGIAAIAAPLGGMLLWLWHKGAFAAWIATERLLLPFYATVERRHFGFTLLHSISPLQALVLLWVVCVVLRGPSWPRFERWLIVTATVLNLLALLAQGKALPYQRYPMLGFLLLLIALDLTTAWQKRRGMAHSAAGYVAWGGLLCGCLVLAPLAVVKAHRFVARPQEFDAMLAADLRNTHGGDLSGRVQCLDTIQECVPTLYTMRLLPATGMLSDLTLFSPAGQPAVAQSRERFLRDVESKPPVAFVVVSGFFLDSSSGYRKLDAWPAFEQWLNAHYTLAAERTLPYPVRWWGRPQPQPGYRLYVWKQAEAGREKPLH